jgi:superoxide reductase
MNFGALFKGEKDEGKEKHVPHMELDKGYKKGMDIIRVVVGHETPHPNTVEHHIGWIEVYGVLKANDQVMLLGRATWAPVHSNPNVRFQINEIGEFKSFHAVAYCNIHGLWSNSLDV